MMELFAFPILRSTFLQNLEHHMDPRIYGLLPIANDRGLKRVARYYGGGGELLWHSLYVQLLPFGQRIVAG